METHPMTVSGQPLAQRRDCSKHNLWVSSRKASPAISLIRNAPLQGARTTGSVRTEAIRTFEGSMFKPENFTLEISRRLLEQPWFDDVLSTVRELLTLGRNWNGSDEQAIQPRAIKRAIHILRIVGEEGPRPSLVPMPNGSVQLEWICRGQTIKIGVPSIGSVSICVSDPSSGDIEVPTGIQSRIWHDLKDRITIGTTNIRRWARAALALAVVEEPNDDCPHFVATVEGCAGAWAYGDSPETALIELESVLFGWAHLKLRDGDTDIPPMEGIDLIHVP